LDPDSYTFHGMPLTNISGGRRLGKKYDKKYGSERLLETYYNYQQIGNPDYNKGCGPADVVSAVPSGTLRRLGV